jgi:hypothetical protein
LKGRIKDDNGDNADNQGDHAPNIVRSEIKIMRPVRPQPSWSLHLAE